jgi:hypothetical protein
VATQIIRFGVMPAQRVWSALTEHFVQPVEHDPVLETEVIELAVEDGAVVGREDLMPAFSPCSCQARRQLSALPSTTLEASHSIETGTPARTAALAPQRLVDLGRGGRCAGRVERDAEQVAGNESHRRLQNAIAIL